MSELDPKYTAEKRALDAKLAEAMGWTNLKPAPKAVSAAGLTYEWTGTPPGKTFGRVPSFHGIAKSEPGECAKGKCQCRESEEVTERPKRRRTRKGEKK